MTIIENLLVQLFTFLLGLASGIALYRFRDYWRDRKNLRDAPKTMALFGEHLYSSIVNEKDSLEARICSLFFDDYRTFIRNKELYDDFRHLNRLYSFFDAGGYKDQPHRIDDDTAAISIIVQKYSQK